MSGPVPAPRTRVVVLAGSLLLAACSQIDNPGKLPPGSPSVEATRSLHLQRVQFDDVPVPRDFAYVTRGNRSFSYARGGVRVGRFAYWGRTPRQQVVTFYRETMPLKAYGWELAGVEEGPDATTLRFTKRQQRCRIAIREGAGDTDLRVHVAGPTSQS